MPRASILAAMPDNVLVQAMGMYDAAGAIKPRPYHPRAAEAQVALEDALSLYFTKQASLYEAIQIGKELIAALGE